MTLRTAWILPLLLLLAPLAAHAANIFEGVTTGAPLLEVNPSVRWRAMGDAGTAAFWDPSNAWANPALLGTATGIQYETGSMDRDLVDFETARTTLGWGGLGLSTTGRPFEGLGKIDMDFGGLFAERVESWSVGVSAARIASTVARLHGNEPAGFTRWVDLSIGYSEKRFEEEFPVLTFTGPPGTEENVATARDLGVLLRGSTPLGPAQLDLAYGYADISTNEPELLFTIRTARDTRNGLAARATWTPEALKSRLPEWLVPGTSPILSLGGAIDFVHSTRFGGDDWRGGGVELGVANVLFGRLGTVGDSDAWGLGVAIPLGRFASVRWDHVYRERIDGVPDERSNAWTVWMDPLAIWGATR